MSLVHFDVAVIGSELCGLVAGAFLAHDHKKVVVVDDGESDERPLGEHLVPRSPTLWRLPVTGPAAQLIEKLGLKQDARRVLGEPTGVGLIDDPLHRILVEPDPVARKTELERALGEGGTPIAAALEALRPDARDGLLTEATLLSDDGFFARRRAKKRQEDGGPLLDPSTTDDATRALAQSALGGALPFLGAFVAHDDEWRADGVKGFLAGWLLRGGAVAHPTEGTSLRGALARRFLHTIEGHGGDVLTATRVKSIEGDARRLTVVRTDGPNDYAVRAVIDATEARTLCARLPDGRGRAESLALDESVALRGGAAIVRFILPRTALPRGLPARAVVLPETADGHAIVVAVFDGLPGRDGRMPKQPSPNVALVAAAKTRERPSDDDALADAIEKRLKALLPFSRNAIVDRDRIVGEAARVALPQYHAPRDAHVLGGRRPATGFKNLARAGRDLAPRLGLEGELAAAPAVAAVIDAAFGKKRAVGAD